MINGVDIRRLLNFRPKGDSIFAGDVDTDPLAAPYARDLGVRDPLTFTQTRGGRRISDGPLCGGVVHVWHKRIFEILRALESSGWDSRPVELKCRDGSVRRDYSRLILEGREPRLVNVPIVIKADFSNANDPLRVRPTVKDIRNVRIPIPRYDLWMIEGTHVVGATARVVEALRAAKVVEMEFEPLVIMKPRKGSRSKRA
jgi:hypothetical protein